jgi:hypothetical protein
MQHNLDGHPEQFAVAGVGFNLPVLGEVGHYALDHALTGCLRRRHGCEYRTVATRARGTRFAFQPK